MKSTTTTLVFAIALTATLALTLIMKEQYSTQGQSFHQADQSVQSVTQPKRVSRFLAANEPKPRNPNAADHCHKDSRVCPLAMPLAGNATCCNNKCVDLSSDSQSCGACKKKCRPFEMCCRGECVNLSYDKRHCGACNNACREGPDPSKAFCVYGMCGYA